MTSFLDYDDNDPVSASRDAASSLSLAKDEFGKLGYTQFLFQASSPEEFDERVRMLRNLDTPGIEPKRVVESLKREFTAALEKKAADACGSCPQGEKCVCSHGSCKCVKTSQKTAMVGPDANELPGSDILVGIDGNAFSIMAHTNKALKAAGADEEFMAHFREHIKSSDYDHLLGHCAEALDGEYDPNHKHAEKDAKVKQASNYSTADVDYVTNHTNEDDARQELMDKPVHDNAYHPDDVEITSLEPRPDGGSYARAQVQYVTNHNSQEDEESALKDAGFDGAEVSYFERRGAKKTAQQQQFAVCPTCEGRGSHVNPSIDSQGLSAEDFAEDPDFEEAYFSGAYDMPCSECHGQRVVPKCAEPSCREPAMAKERGGWSDHRDNLTGEHHTTCYDHLSGDEKESYEAIAEMDAEMAAERRMGA